MKRLFLVVPALTWTLTTFAQTPAPVPVRIFVTSASAEAASASGRTDTTDSRTRDIVRDLTEIIDKHKGGMKGGILIVAAERAGADLVLEFRTLEDARMGTTPADIMPRDRVPNGPPPVFDNATLTTAKATLVVGTVRQAIEATASSSPQALERLARDVEAFARANAAKLRSPVRD